MAKSYRKICDYCKQEIEMSNKGGKWLPYNQNNGQHDCRDRDREREETKQDPTTKQEFTLETVRKNLASIGIILDLDKLMNSK